MDFDFFMNMEEYERSFSYLDAKLVQLSKGSFRSTVHTSSTEFITLERRVTTSSHIHYCSVSEDILNFVFTNLDSNLNINGSNISNKNQALVKGGEEIKAIVQGKLDITCVSLSMSNLIANFPDISSNIENLSGEMVRSAYSNLKVKDDIRLLTNSYLKYIQMSGNLQDQIRTDLFYNILFKIVDYLECFHKPHIYEKIKLSKQELNRILDFIAHSDVLSLKELQTVCKCTPRTLCNLINKQFGCSPFDLISIIRLNQIHRYLKCKTSEKKSLKHLSEKFGVHSPYRLGRAYKQMFGKSIQETIKQQF